jgi:hypothetical protein
MNVLFFLSFGVSVFKFVGLFLPGRFLPFTWQGLAGYAGSRYDSSAHRSRLLREIEAAELMARRLEKITKAAEQTSKHILDGMFEIRKANVKGGKSPQERSLIAGNLEKIAPRETEVFKTLSYLRDVTRKLADFDFHRFEQLKGEFDTVSEQARKMVKPELYDEWKKLGVEKELQRMEKSAVSLDQDFTRAVRLMVESLRNNRPEEALRWIDQAIDCEKRIVIMLRDMRQLEKKLESITRQVIQDEKRKIVQ